MGWAIIAGYALCAVLFLSGRSPRLRMYNSEAEGVYLGACLLFSLIYQLHPVGPKHWLFDLYHTAVPGLLVGVLLNEVQKNVLSWIAVGSIFVCSGLRSVDLYPAFVLGCVWISYSMAIGLFLFVFARSQQLLLTDRIRVWCYPFIALVLLLDHSVFVLAHYPVLWEGSKVTRWMYGLQLSSIGASLAVFLYKTWYIHRSLKPLRGGR